MSKVLGRWADPKRVAARRAGFEAKRRRAGGAHVVEYFHQVDDGYSHHLVPGPGGRNAPEPDMLFELFPDDGATIAPHYELGFPNSTGRPDAELDDIAMRNPAGSATDPNDLRVRGSTRRGGALVRLGRNNADPGRTVRVRTRRNGTGRSGGGRAATGGRWPLLGRNDGVYFLLKIWYVKEGNSKEA